MSKPFKMDTKLRSLVVATLRRVSQFTEEKKKVLKRCSVGSWKYECEQCSKIVGYRQYDIDHIIPVGVTPGSRNDKEGRTWDDYIAALFCSEENLRLICKPCHKKKTYNGK